MSNQSLQNWSKLFFKKLGLSSFQVQLTELDDSIRVINTDLVLMGLNLFSYSLKIYNLCMNQYFGSNQWMIQIIKLIYMIILQIGLIQFSSSNHWLETVEVNNISLLLIGLNLLLLPEKLRFDEDYEWSCS